MKAKYFFPDIKKLKKKSKFLTSRSILQEMLKEIC